jgi:hypothetical protein
LQRRAEERRVALPDEASTGYARSFFSGGQTKWQGQAYYWFFSSLMLVAAVLYIPFARFYSLKSNDA